MSDRVSVLLPGALRRLFPGAPAQVEVVAGTVAEAIAALDGLWPGMQDRLCDTTPAIRRHLRVFVDGEAARLDSTVPPGGEVLVMTAISGG